MSENFEKEEERQENKTGNRAFDMLVDNTEKLADAIKDLNQRMSRIEGGLKVVAFLFTGGSIVSIVLYLIKTGVIG